MTRIRKKPATKKPTRKTLKQRMLRRIQQFLQSKDDIASAQDTYGKTRDEILVLGKKPGMADRIDPDGHRYFGLPNDDENEFKIERRVRTELDHAAALAKLKKTKKGRTFITVTVTGGRELRAFLKRHGFTDYEVEESVEDANVLKARQAGLLDDDDLAEMSTQKESFACKLSPVREE